jgi:transposase
MTTPLRDDYDASKLRVDARKTKAGGQARRLLALAAIYDGSSRTEAAEIGGVTLQIVRDWVLKFNALGPGGLIDGKAPGKPSRLNDAQRAAVMAIVESGPTPAIHEVVRWRLVDLCRWVLEEFRVVILTLSLLSGPLRAGIFRL